MGVNSRVFPLGSIVLAIMAITTPALAQREGINALIDDLLGDHLKYERVIDALKTAVVAHDAAGVAALVRYPIRVAVKGRKVRIASAAAFIANYRDIVTPEIASAVTGTRYEDLFVRDQGVMFGSGQVWIGRVCRDAACGAFDAKVITIQSASPAG